MYQVDCWEDKHSYQVRWRSKLPTSPGTHLVIRVKLTKIEPEQDQISVAEDGNYIIFHWKEDVGWVSYNNEGWLPIESVLKPSTIQYVTEAYHRTCIQQHTRTFTHTELNLLERKFDL